MTDADFLGLDEPVHDTTTGHRIWSDHAVELEMAVLLYGIVRYAKPRLVVESGTGSGRSTKAILKGLRENGGGKVATFEPVGRFFIAAEEMFRDDPQVEVFQGASRHHDFRPDMVFVDTGGGNEYRQPEIDYWLAHDDRPLVVVHDGNRGYGLSSHNGLNIRGYDGVWIGTN